MLAFVKKIVLAVVIAVVLLFAYQNMQALSQSIHFQFDLYAEGMRYQTPAFPLVFLFVLFFLLGMLTAGFHGIYERFARKAEVRRREKRIRQLEKEQEGLRSQVAQLRPPAPPEPSPEPEPSPGPSSQTVEPQRSLAPPKAPAKQATPPVLPDEDVPTL